MPLTDARRILIVEDNPGDVRLVKEALAVSKLRSCIPHVAFDGQNAVELLHNGDIKPDLILLDLNLPRLTGDKVLEIIKKDDRFRSIPVVVFSSSTAFSDIDRAYRLHANCFVHKPSDLDDFFRAVTGIADFWLALAALPSEA